MSFTLYLKNKIVAGLYIAGLYIKNIVYKEISEN